MELSPRAAELTTLLESRISNFYTDFQVDEIGRCVYVAIRQKCSTLAKLVQIHIFHFFIKYVDNPPLGSEPPVKILLYHVKNLLILLILSKLVTLGLGYLFMMDELLQAVEPFCNRAPGSMPGGGGVPDPGPSGDGGMIGATISWDNPNRERAVPPGRFIPAVEAAVPGDNLPEMQWRTTTENQEQFPFLDPADDADYQSVAQINDSCSAIENVLVERTRIFLQNNGITVESPKDVRTAVEIALLESWKKDVHERRSEFTHKRANLIGHNGITSPLMREILRELRALRNR